MLTTKISAEKEAFHRFEPLGHALELITAFTPIILAKRLSSPVTRLRVYALIVGLLGVLVGSAALAATITVNSLADPGTAGTCTLRDAITAANTMTATNGCAAGTGNDTVQFSLMGTITLAATLPEVTGIVTITGPASPGITISGGDKVQVMQVASGATLDLENLTIADGLAESVDGAGGISNQGTLTVTNSTFSGNSGGPFEFSGAAGAIANWATLTVINSTVSDNSAGANTGTVGGIFNQGTLTVIDSTVSGNRTAFNSGDGGISSLGTLTVTNSTFSNNVGDGRGAIYNGGTATITNSTFPTISEALMVVMAQAASVMEAVLSHRRLQRPSRTAPSQGTTQLRQTAAVSLTDWEAR